MNTYQNVPSGKKTLTLVGIYAAMIAMLMVTSGVSTLLPEAAKEIGGETVYSLAQTLQGVLGIILMPLYAYIGTKSPWIKRALIAVSLFIGGAAMICCGFAANMWTVIIFSILLGFIPAAIYVTSFSLIRDLYDSKRAGALLGVVGTIVAFGILAGSTVTGVTVQLLGWRTMYSIWGVVFAIAGLLVLFGAKISRGDSRAIAVDMGMFDLPGTIATTLFLGGLVLALSLTNYAPFGSAYNFLFFAIAAVGLIWLIFDIRQKKTKAFIPAPVLKDRNTLCLTLNNFFCSLSAMVLFFFLPSYVIYVMALTPAYAGLVLTIFSIPGLFMGPVFGRIIGKSGNARGVSIVTQIIRIAIHIGFAVILSPETPIFLVYTLMFIGGFYGSTGSVIPAAAPQIQINPEIRQLGNSMVQLAQNLGASISIAIYTMVISMNGIESGFKIACVVAAVFAAGALLVSFPLKKLETAETETGTGKA
jgi:MFS family permease